jgi:septal ring-binding cell division protein DamX
LDTLNKGKEIALSDNDLKPIMPESTAIVGDSKGTGGEGFRIQCFASSQIDRIRSEQKQLETKVKYPIYVVFNAPYYKLLVGDFAKRSDADAALLKLKEIGYGDAWVARSRINSAR